MESLQATKANDFLIYNPHNVKGKTVDRVEKALTLLITYCKDKQLISQNQLPIKVGITTNFYALDGCVSFQRYPSSMVIGSSGKQTTIAHELAHLISKADDLVPEFEKLNQELKIVVRNIQ